MKEEVNLKMKYDVAIKNGTIIDPKGKKSTIANIGILNGKISTITREDIVGLQQLLKVLFLMKVA